MKLKRILVSSLMLVCVGGYNVWAQQEIGFNEKFALAGDRRAVLSELIPGTEEFYYYHCLHFQNEKQLAEAQATLDRWKAQLGDTGLAQRMSTRQMLLTYNENPQRALDFLQNHLGLNLHHAPPSRDRAAALPTALDNSQLDINRLIEEALRRDRGLNQIENSGLALLLDKQLAPDQLRALLQRIDRADLPKLVERIAEELALQDSQGFGWAAIHRSLTLENLDQLLKLRPQLLGSDNYVRAYAARLAPPNGTSLVDQKELRDYLQRLLAFVRRLPAQQNSFKALVLGNILRQDMHQGRFDRALFLEYLALPRNAAYYDMKRFQNQNVSLAELNFSVNPEVPLPPMGDDSLLIRNYLEHFLRSDDKLDDFAKLLDRDYLDRVLAETKILYGIGDSATWYAKLSPGDQKLLRERVELRFAPQNVNQFAAADKARLEVDVKNISQLIIKIYEINTVNYYRNHTEPISTAIDLDGLVANIEKKFDYSQPAQLRHRESIDLSELEGRGVWVIDFLGGGQRSRALIQKGSLTTLDRMGDAGHVFRIIDETGNPLKTAHIELGGKTYEPDSEGRIILPYAEQTVARNLILVDGGFASSVLVAHHSESYSLEAGFLVDRQSLVAGTQASIAIRSRLTCNSRPISIKLLEQPQLTIVATDVEGVSSTQTVGSLDLEDGDELVHKFLVPQRLASLSITLSGKVYNQNRDERQPVSAAQTVSCNAIQQTDQIGDFFLRQSNDGFALLVLGRNGEPISRLPVSIAVKVKNVAFNVDYSLATNANGLVDLGKLENVQQILFSAQAIRSLSVPLHRFHRDWPNVVQRGLNAKIELPLGKDTADRRQFALTEIRRGVSVASVDKNLKVGQGSLEISNLPAGDYHLHDYEAGQVVQIVIADTAEDSSLLAANYRILQSSSKEPLIIRSAKIDGNDLLIELSGSDSMTRVHVVADALYPDVESGHQMQLPYPTLMQKNRLPTLSLYVDSLRLDEEYSYILERQGSKKYPGNMLPQPSLLVQPWEVSVTENQRKDAAAGDALPPGAAPAPSPMQAREQMKQEKAATQRPDWKSYDFLASSASIASNLGVEKGQVRLPIDKLKGYSQLTVVAVHPLSSDSRQVTLKSPELLVRDQRLRKAFDPEIHLAQTQRVKVLTEAGKQELGDPRTRRIQIYGTVGDVFQLYATLLSNPEWEKFRFVSQWHQLSDDERKARYNEMACHELNFYLYHKDRAFFDAVIKPLIAQKLDKQLVDLWLLGEPLSGFDQLWRIQRLNTLERILLAQSIQARREGTLRWLGDFVAANPLDPQWRATRFEVALRGSALDVSNESLQALFLSNDDPVDKSRVLSESLDSAPRGFGGAGGGAADARSLRRRAGRVADEKEKSVKDDDFLSLERGSVMGRFVAPQKLFETLDQTREWAETQYYRIRLQNQVAALIPASPFWKDYLSRAGQGTFLPESLDLPTSSINEALVALAVLDLPLEARPAEVTIENEQLAVTTQKPSVVFIESIEKAGQGDANNSVLVGQDLYLAQPSTNEDANRPVQGPLLRGVPYRTSVVVTNPSNSKQTVQVLTQLPAGSLPLASGKVTRSSALILAPYSTAQVQYAFYFPAAGEFGHYGAQISRDEKHIIATNSTQYRVLAEPQSVDESAWSYIADWGTNAQVLEYLKKANLARIDLARIAFRMQDKPFFDEVTSFLAMNNHFEPTLWAYSVLHKEPKQIEQLLQNRPDFLAQLGDVLQSELINFVPKEQFSYEHLDYKPLVVARAHRLGKQNVILNNTFKAQYDHLLSLLSHQNAIDDSQKMELCYYLLLQNRIEEALTWFERVDADKLATRLQYDYFDSYLDFHGGQYDKAAQVASKYTEYPVLKWRDLFAAVGDQVRQRKALAAGQDITSVTSLEGNANRQQRMLIDGRESQLNAAAAETPTLDVTQREGTLKLEYRNLSDVRVNYYLMDIELLFSRNPFVSRNEDGVPVIEPNHSELVKLDSANGSMQLELPAALENRNLLVELSAKGVSRTAVITANSLAVTVVEPFGRLQVLSSQGRSPLEQAYVKVYARHQDGSVRFYKDGYTDLRGQFDYATLSTSDLNSVQRFAILILHPTQGALVREAAPPTR